MSVCDYCNFHKYGECQKLEDLLEDVEDDYYDYQIKQGDIRDDR